MNRLFLLLFGAATFVAHAQVPDYVPTEGLVGWWPLEGNAEDAHQNMDGVVYGASEGIGPNDSPCLNFDGVDDYVEVPTNPTLESIEDELTISCWFLKSNSTNSKLVVKRNFVGNPNGERHHFEFAQTTQISHDRAFVFSSYDNSDLANHNCQVWTNDDAFDYDVWTHASVTFANGLVKFFVDGYQIHEHDCGFQQLPPNNHWLNFARMHRSGGAPFSGELEGGMQNVGIWNRALTEEEIFALYNAEPPIPGCTDTTACNFEAEATSDDGSCIPSGCTNEAACNFNPDAGCDDESCEFDEDLLDCDAFAFELDSLVVCFGEEFELTAPITNSPGALSGTAQFIDEFYLDFGAPSSHTLGDQPAGSYQITVSGTWCGGSCWNGHTSDAAYSFNHPYGNGVTPLGGNSFTINEYCPQDDNSCELIRPEPDEYNPDHIYTYLFEHPGGELVFYGLADECCWWDNQAGLNFSVSLLPISPCVLDYSWNNGANEPSILVEPEASDFLTVTVSSSTEQCTDSLWIEVVNQGCSDAEACNFNPSDLCTVDCIFPVLGAVDCDQGAETCGEGTIWNSETQTCVPEPTDPTASEISCGPGTYWDDLESLCLPIETCEDDLDGDGVIGVNDLMQLLSSFGTDCAPAAGDTGDTGGDTETAEFACGDPISYHGYDYATVLIGEQCWFAENLRASQYTNGDSIPGDLTNDEWISTSNGAQAVYQNETENLNDFGRLYNYFSVLDVRGLCPTGWKIPSTLEWDVLDEFSGGSLTAGLHLKASENDNPAWNGSNSLGFHGLPAGYRRSSDGEYVFINISGLWWTEDGQGEDTGYIRYLSTDEDNLWGPALYDAHIGFSVRCLKDQ